MQENNQLLQNINEDQHEKLKGHLAEQCLIHHIIIIQQLLLNEILHQAVATVTTIHNI